MATWDVQRVRRHMFDNKAYTTSEKWTASPLQVFRLLEQDFLFQCRAFKHVVPSVPMTPENNAAYLTEDWRRFKIDLGHFACRHCRQYSKGKFCEEVKYPCHICQSYVPHVHPFNVQVVTIMVAEKILHAGNMPPDFQSNGIESHVGDRTQARKTNVYGVAQELTSPEKVTQRFSSQAKSRRGR